MSLLGLIRTGVKIADRQTKSLQPSVTYERYTGQSGYGKPTYASPVQLRAIVDWKQQQVRTLAGILSVSRSSVLFLDAAAVAAATSGQGIDEKDKITLPDGSTGPILDMAGFVDAGTGHPVATEVFLG